MGLIPDVSVLKINIIDQFHLHVGGSHTTYDQSERIASHEPANDYADAEAQPVLTKKQKRKLADRAMNLQIYNETLTPLMGFMGFTYAPALFIAANNGGNPLTWGLIATGLSLVTTAPITIAYAMMGIEDKIPLKDVFKKPAKAFATVGVVAAGLGWGIGEALPRLPIFPETAGQTETCIPAPPEPSSPHFKMGGCF
jgi:hypothetical protein